MPNFQHVGLYFTAEHIRAARKNRDREPLKTAWEHLLTTQPDDPLAAIQWDALRYRFDDDNTAGERAVAALSNNTLFTAEGEAYTVLSRAVILAQTFEMLRYHPAFAGTSDNWLQAFAAFTDTLNNLPPNARHHERLWLGLVNIAAGIVLEDEARLETGASTYRNTIDHDIHPGGYIPQAVDGKDGDSLYRTVLSLGALVLMAEAAAHVGLDLWSYNARGVSVMTAAAYPIYYYYYPEKWRWDTLADDAKAVFPAHGGFLEILNHHARPKDVNVLLDDLRPLHDATAGGLPSLTHGVVRRSLFG